MIEVHVLPVEQGAVHDQQRTFNQLQRFASENIEDRGIMGEAAVLIELPGNRRLPAQVVLAASELPLIDTLRFEQAPQDRYLGLQQSAVAQSRIAWVQPYFVTPGCNLAREALEALGFERIGGVVVRIAPSQKVKGARDSH